ncbi:hypothetical protein VNI00_015068 [Paramarasmius palmivorus]|uniref:Uncharacterized protein n=1 Tax=Paramarasmius palmivorus TaxID=297713 RepID=A0AAW0BMZ2_9AGAR
MFFIATFHIAINMYRLLLAFGDYCGRSHGPEFYLGRLNRWDHVLKDGFYATQEIFGSAAAIYRTWILWNRSWRVIALPLLMLCGECITGYRTLAIFAHVDPTHNIFDPHLTAWITSFFALTVSLNIITTGLMSYIIWMTHKLSLSYQSSGSRLLQVMRIVIESASLQLIVELILLVFYCSDSNAQYVALELVTPIVAITFNAITIRLKLLAIKEEVESSGIPSINPGHANGTVGSIPMRRIQINISQDVDIDANSNIGTSKTRIVRETLMLVASSCALVPIAIYSLIYDLGLRLSYEQ